MTITVPTDLDQLGLRWRALETRADFSFFQSWSWVGCLAAERFSDPVLLAVREDGRDVALALFNRSPTQLSPNTLWLGESGVPSLDAMYVEHNGILQERGRDDLLALCLQALLHSARGLKLVFSGVGDATLNAARGSGAALRVYRSQPAPYVDIAGLPSGPDGFLNTLSAGTRYQLRRSARRYAATGKLTLHRATTTAEAETVLDTLAPLHQATWTTRGRPGAFANPDFRRFHTALISRALPRGEVDLLRVTAGGELIGCLYNFRHGGDVLTYQSGFNYEAAGAHQKPGLTCHHLAIEQARRDGVCRYDFMAGEDRYKASLASGATMLHWLELSPRWSNRGMVTRLRLLVRD